MYLYLIYTYTYEFVASLFPKMIGVFRSDLNQSVHFWPRSLTLPWNGWLVGSIGILIVADVGGNPYKTGDDVFHPPQKTNPTYTTLTFLKKLLVFLQGSWKKGQQPKLHALLCSGIQKYHIFASSLIPPLIDSLMTPSLPTKKETKRSQATEGRAQLKAICRFGFFAHLGSIDIFGVKRFHCSSVSRHQKITPTKWHLGKQQLLVFCRQIKTALPKPELRTIWRIPLLSR